MTRYITFNLSVVEREKFKSQTPRGESVNKSFCHQVHMVPLDGEGLVLLKIRQNEKMEVSSLRCCLPYSFGGLVFSAI